MGFKNDKKVKENCVVIDGQMWYAIRCGITDQSYLDFGLFHDPTSVDNFRGSIANFLKKREKKLWANGLWESTNGWWGRWADKRGGLKP